MRVKLALGVLAMVCLAAPIAMADGGGGGMGSSPPGNASGNSSRSANSPEAEYQAGVAAYNAQNYREAIRHFREVRRSAPNDGLINYALGLAYAGADEDEDALRSYERAVRAPNVPGDAFVRLGTLYIELNRRDDATALQGRLNEAIAECDAQCGDARRQQLQAAQSELTQALAAPAGAPAADPATTGWNFPNNEEGRVAYAEAVGLINQERFPAALDALARAEAAFGPHPDVLTYMGFVNRKMGRYEEALAYYDTALAIEPNHLGANEYLGELYIEMGDMGRAHAQLARLDQLCAYGCEQREELARWIATAGR